MNAAVNWCRRNASRLLVGGASLICAVGVMVFVISMLNQGQTTLPSEGEQLKVQLSEQASAAEAQRTAAHKSLLDDLDVLDLERVATDTATSRELVLALAGTSASSLPHDQLPAVLAAQHPLLAVDSQPVTGFLPEWLAATTPRGPQTYTLTSFEVEVTAVEDLDYSYLGLARLDPVLVDGAEAGAPQFIAVTVRTDTDGAITGFQAYRASDATRDNLTD